MLDHLHFSDEQKARMVDHLMQAQQAGQPARKHRRPLRRRVVAPLAGAAVLTVGAGAAYMGLASGAFAAVFGTEETEIIDKIGYPVGVSDTDAGFTITADAIMGDKYSVNIIYTITADDGRELHADRMLAEDTLEFQRSGMGGSTWFADDTPGDNQVQYIMQYTVDDENGLRQGRATAEFTKLQEWNPETEQAEVIAEGKWKLRFDMRYEDIGTSVIDQPVAVQAEAGTAMLRAVYLSPLGFRITADYPEVNAQTQQEIDSFEMPESGREPQNTPYEKLTGLDIFLTLKDGTKLDLGTCMGSSCDLKTREIVLRDTFRDQVIPLDQMESITIENVTLPVSAD